MMLKLRRKESSKTLNRNNLWLITLEFLDWLEGRGENYVEMELDERRRLYKLQYEPRFASPLLTGRLCQWLKLAYGYEDVFYSGFTFVLVDREMRISTIEMPKEFTDFASTLDGRIMSKLVYGVWERQRLVIPVEEVRRDVLWRAGL